jgi:uncharacterized protein (DUF1015 family)
MAEVAPFKALRYHHSNITDMSKVVTPPYDVISSEQQERFYQLEPHNIIRLELNQTRPTDTVDDSCYTRAAAHLRSWMAGGVLMRDSQPAFYVSETTYTDLNGETKVRTGFFTLLRVEDFSSGVVLPHEKTFTGHREDRVKLIKATSTNISPIFALYPDKSNQIQSLLGQARQASPLADFTDPMGLGQKLFAVDDPQAQQQVIKLMADKAVFIADGHHRYETALEYRDFMQGKHPQAGPQAAFNYVMVYLCSMSDPGLTVFPCHRLVPQLDGFTSQDFLLHAQDFFEWEEIPVEGNVPLAQERLLQCLDNAGQRGRSFGLVSTEGSAFYVFTLKNGTVSDSAWRNTPEPLRDLDVVMLTEVVLDRILGLDNLARDQIHTIQYLSDTEQVISQVRAGRARVGFMLNPTRVQQVEAVARAGLIMPRKSTYFYPKVLTGLTLNLVDPQEEIPVL